MCWMALIPAAIAVVGGVMGAQNAKAQGAFQSASLEQNAAYKELAAQDAIVRGTKEADQQRIATRNMIGTQRAALAGNGIDVNTGTAAEIQDNTAQFGEMDAVTIANNAAREAWGYRVGAENDRNNARFARSNAKSSAFGSLLGGVGGAFGAFGGSGGFS